MGGPFSWERTLPGKGIRLLSLVLAFGLLHHSQQAAAQASFWKPDQKAVTWHWQSWQQKDGSVNWQGVTTDLNAMHQAGITWARMHIGPEMSDELVDHLVRLAESRDVHFLVLVADTDTIAKTESPEWLASMDRKYKGRIHVWEIGNEENNSQYWSLDGGRAASVARYVDYLRQGYVAMKEANPDAAVLMGGLMGWHVEAFLPTFLKLGGGQFTDGFNIHPYAETPDAVGDRLSMIREEIASDASLRDKPIWITEIGFFANERNWKNAGRVPNEETKATYLRQTIERLRKLGISTPIFWYNFHDPDPGVCGYSLVLFDVVGHEVALPAYRSYQALPPVGPGKPARRENRKTSNVTCP
jgi:hypothetical protein